MDLAAPDGKCSTNILSMIIQKEITHHAYNRGFHLITLEITIHPVLEIDLIPDFFCVTSIYQRHLRLSKGF